MRAVAQGLTAIPRAFGMCFLFTPVSLANMTQPLDHFDEELDVGSLQPVHRPAIQWAFVSSMYM